MKRIHHDLKKVQKLERKKYHPLIHQVHKKHQISKRTLFYIKEYGSHSHVPRTIIRESIKILIFASILSSLGGLAFEQIKEIFISITPLIILLPTLNGMIGGYGGIFSSKFATLLHEHKQKETLKKALKKLMLQLLIISLITAFSASLLALGISSLKHPATPNLAAKIIAITLIDTLLLITILFCISIGAGIYVWKKQEDPNNFLIPITTSIADFGNMIILAVLIVLFF